MKKNFSQKAKSRKTIFLLLLFFIILIHIALILSLQYLSMNKINALNSGGPKTNRKLNDDDYEKDYQEKQEKRDKNGQNVKIVLISILILILY